MCFLYHHPGSLPDRFLNIANLTSRPDTESIHDNLTVNGRLPVAQMILFLYLDDSLADLFIIVQISADSEFIFRSDISLTEHHKVIDIITCIKKQPANSR